MRNSFSPPPEIKRSVVQLQCEKCGRETHANCDCGAIYKPKAFERVAEYDKANPGKSTRQAAADLGTSAMTVSKARGVNQFTPDTVTGRDQKTYPAKKPRPIYTPEPGEDDLIDFVVEHFMKLSFQAQTRCALRLRNIIQGRAS